MKAQLFDFLYSLPVSLTGQIGKLKRLKSDTRSIHEDNWRSQPVAMPDPEARLCSDYYAAFGENISSKPIFENAYQYLVHSYQTDTRPMRLWEHALLVTLTLAEAAGTGFLLAPWVSQEMSASQLGYVGWIIAFAFAFGMLILTHFAGNSYKKAALFKSVVGELDPGALTHVRPISPSMPQDSDEAANPEIRFVARVSKGPKDRGSIWPTVATVLVLGAALAFIFYIRWEGIKEAATHQVVQLEKNGVSGSSSNPFASMGANSGASSLPPAIQQAQQKARSRVAKELGREQEGQGFGAAALLSFIYIMTQSAGFLFTYKHAFLGDGERAYELTHGESHYETYVRAVASPYLNRAESRLAELRQSLINTIPDYGKHPSHVSFMNYYQHRQESKLRQEDLAGLIHQQGSLGVSAPSAPASSPAPCPAPVPLPVPENNTLGASGDSTGGEDRLRAMAEEIFNLADAAARKARFQECAAGLGRTEQLKLLDYFNQIKDEHAHVQSLADDLFKS